MLSLLAAAIALTPLPAFVERPCVDLPASPRLRCGTVSVPEDRGQPNGRRIALNVVIIVAEKPTPDRQSLFELEGGPGLADTNNAAFYLNDGIGYAATRDVVLIDQRGTGRSNPLDCPEFDTADRKLAPMFSLEAVEQCRKRLSSFADLTRYGTNDAVEDLDDVRRALGLNRIDLIALSYGTTLALRYIAMHGEKVRSAVLFSAVPTSAMPPRHHADAGQAALDQLLADCAADADCKAKYPNLRGDLQLALDKLRKQSGDLVGPAMERLRTRLHTATGTRQAPAFIHRLAKGDLTALDSDARAAFNYFDGVYMTITCSESLPWFNHGPALAQARRTAFGDYRLARQIQACANWPRAKLPAQFFAPVRSNVPTLFISGGRDPVTPSDWARDAARGFARGRHIVIPWAGHVIDGLSGLDTCFDPQMIRFIETADPEAIEAACFAQMLPPPFA